MSVSRRIVLLVLVNVLSATFAMKSVSISKCCNKDEVLTLENTCAKNETSSWDMRIFNGRKNAFEKFLALPDHWKIIENTKPNCARPVMLFYQSNNNFPFLNGSLYSIEYDKLFHPDQFCLDYNSALVCIQPQRITFAIIKKCCGSNAIFSETNNTCIHLRDDSYKIDIGQDKTLAAGFPVCVGNDMQVVGELHKSKILNNGSLLVDNGIFLPAGNYCVEHVLEHTGRSASIIACSEHMKPHIRPLPTESEIDADIRFTIYPIALAVSVIFLAATLAAGTLLPASHHALHWRCQTNHVACLMLADILLCITHLARKISFVPCFGIAVLMHFLFLAGFFWLNTMCFNIWWTFRDMRPQHTEKGQERLRLRLYEAYAWGVPFLIALTAASIDLTNTTNYDVIKPKFGENSCWFHGEMEKLVFFYGPIGFLLVINLVLFGLTARELTCGLWKRELVKSTTERAALGRVCMKLVVVMGIAWIADILSWVIGGPKELWYLTDIINSLHGLFIFIVVGCQPQVLLAVKRIWCSSKHRQNGTAGTTNHHSSSSQGPPSMGDTLTNTNSVTNGITKSVPLETSC